MQQILRTLQINGQTIHFRYPVIEDAKAMREYINTLSQERTFIRFQGETISLEDEIKYLNDQIKKFAEKKAVKILACHNEELIGIADINLQEKTEKHLGLFGLTVKKEWRRLGIGRELMKLTLSEAKSNLTGLKMVILGVFANNPNAQRLYQSFGFKEYGRLPNGVSLANGYMDHLNMYLPIEKIETIKQIQS